MDCDLAVTPSTRQIRRQAHSFPSMLLSFLFALVGLMAGGVRGLFIGFLLGTSVDSGAHKSRGSSTLLMFEQVEIARRRASRR
jgi:hypothetical protein